jgi:hypothetical protein
MKISRDLPSGTTAAAGNELHGLCTFRLWGPKMSGLVIKKDAISWCSYGYGSIPIKIPFLEGYSHP